MQRLFAIKMIQTYKNRLSLSSVTAWCRQSNVAHPVCRYAEVDIWQVHSAANKA